MNRDILPSIYSDEYIKFVDVFVELCENLLPVVITDVVGVDGYEFGFNWVLDDLENNPYQYRDHQNYAPIEILIDLMNLDFDTTVKTILFRLKVKEL